MLPLLCMFADQTALPEIFTDSLGVRIIRSNGELVEELYAVANGKRTLVLASPTHPSVKPLLGEKKANLLQGTNTGLFHEPPTFAFEEAARISNSIVLRGTAGEWQIEKRITVPAKGKEVRIDLKATTNGPYPQIRYLLNSYAFVPGQPDTTFTPGFRPADNQVVGDHMFRAPVVLAQKGAVAASLMPDLDVLAQNRPIPTIIDIDCKNGVVDKPLISYGFADHKLVGHVYYASDASMVRPVPGDLQLGMTVHLDVQAEPKAAYREPTRLLWERYGARYFDEILPQAMPFADYARVCYPAAFAEKETGGWFEHELNGNIVGGVPAGWGLREGWVSWQGWFNQLRSAWGLRWWGKKLGEKDWVEKADKMLNLALAAPMNQGAVPTTYLSRTKEWKGSLISPSPECYYDLTNMAWKGIWLMKWLEFDDCPRREEIDGQLAEMAKLMLKYQNQDGSFPSWLTKDLKVVPILDHSAQSALPTWFLAAYSFHVARLFEGRIDGLKKQLAVAGTEETKRQLFHLEEEIASFKGMTPSIDRAAKFLVNEVVPKQRYYDFETFFSCSPKQCLQRNGVIDDLNMWDQHSMQAPQNTLCMQWTAEALRLVSSTEFDDLRDRVAGRPRTAGPDYMMASAAALDMMALYQNVWPLNYRKAAYTYGGFGVQNSDGEYNDARQAQFGATLCHFGAQLGRKDYFQRGVAAIRASLTLINHPLHESLGLYPNPNYPLGLQPENTGHGGTDQQNGRTGFDWGEGSGLAAAAEVLDKYGPNYISPQGWSVAIDIEAVDPKNTRLRVEEKMARLHQGVQPLNSERLFDFTNWRMPGWAVEGDFLNWPTRSRRMDFNAGSKPFIGTCEDGKGGFDDDFTGTFTSAPFLATKRYMKLLVGGGSGEGVYVELIDATGKQIYLERGRNTERMDERTWDLSLHQGKPLRIRIVDQEKGGWGHINVGSIRME